RSTESCAGAIAGAQVAAGGDGGALVSCAGATGEQVAGGGDGGALVSCAGATGEQVAGGGDGGALVSCAAQLASKSRPEATAGRSSLAPAQRRDRRFCSLLRGGARPTPGSCSSARGTPRGRGVDGPFRRR